MAYLFILLVTTLLFFSPLLSSRLIFIERDLAVFFIPPRYLWVDMLRRLELPLWNPYQYSGIPLLATLQPGILYPPHVLYLLLPFNIVWNWLIIIHFFLSGMNTYLFMRYLKASKTASFVASIVFVLSGYMLSVHNLVPHLFAVSWFPLLLKSFLVLLERRQIRYCVYTAIILTLQFLSGAPEIVIMSLFVLFVLFVITSYKEPAHIRYPLLMCLFFILLSSIQLLPFLELQLMSVRQKGLSFIEATTWSFAWKDFIQFFFSDLYGYAKDEDSYWLNQSWLKTVYLGFGPFCLSIIYMLSRDKRRWLIILFMILSIALALGRYNPLYRFIYHIPPFTGIRYPVKFLFVFFFLISVTSGLGIDTLRSLSREMDKRVYNGVRVIFFVGFVFVVLWAYLVVFRGSVEVLFERIGLTSKGFNEPGFNIHNMRRFFFFASLLSLMPLFYIRVRFKKTALFFIVSILGLDLFLSNYGYYSYAPWGLYMEKTRFVETMEKGNDTGRYFVTPKTAEDFKHFPYNKIALGPYYASLYGLYSIDGSEVLRVRWHDVFLWFIRGSPTFDGARRLLDIAGVRYVVSSVPIKEGYAKRLDSEEIRQKAKTETVSLYELDRYKRLHIAGKAEFSSDEGEIIKRMADRKFNPDETVLIYEKETKGAGEGVLKDKDKGGEIKWHARFIRYGANRIEIEAQTDRDAWLYLSDTYYPGWKAYVDGRETKIYRANLAFRAIKIPKGGHTVVFRYVPVSLYIGLILTVIGICLSVIVLKRPKKRPDNKGDNTH